MHLNKILFTSSVLILVLCTGAVTSLKVQRRMGSDLLRVFPLRQRKLAGHGRSMDNSSPVSASSVDESRGFLKKFMLFKSMFQQPESNVIVIAQQPTTTTTSPTTTTTTTPVTRTARRDSDMVGGQLSRRSGNNSGNRKRRRNRLQRNQNRIRLQHTANNYSKVSSPAANIYSINGSVSNNDSLGDNNNNIDAIPTPGGLSLNTNARIQNLVNALRRQQTSVVYN